MTEDKVVIASPNDNTQNYLPKEAGSLAMSILEFCIRPSGQG